MFGHNEQQDVRREGEASYPRNTVPTVQHGAGSIMLWGRLTASGSAALQKVNGIIKKEDYLQFLKSSTRNIGSWVQVGAPTGQ